MKIGINALYLLPGAVGGSEVYLRNLLRTFETMGRGRDCTIFVNQEASDYFSDVTLTATAVRCPIRGCNRVSRILWEQWVLPVQVQRRRLDVLLSAGMTAPFFCKAASVLTVHDLQHAHQPRNFPRLYGACLRIITYWSAKSADRIIAVSEAVRRDVIETYKISETMVATVPHGVGTEFRKAAKDAVERTRRRYGLPGRYLFYPASLHPHKNHDLLFKAFKSVREKHGDLLLVLSGPRDAQRDIVTRAGDLGLKREVVDLGWIPYEEMSALYGGAALLVYPSRYEGFGLPLLEAMTRGVPVVCSSLSALREVAGDAAIYVNPDDASDIARGIHSVLADGALRRELIERGRRRAQQFTWEDTAKKTLALLASCAEEKAHHRRIVSNNA